MGMWKFQFTMRRDDQQIRNLEFIFDDLNMAMESMDEAKTIAKLCPKCNLITNIPKFHDKYHKQLFISNFPPEYKPWFIQSRDGSVVILLTSNF